VCLNIFEGKVVSTQRQSDFYYVTAFVFKEDELDVDLASISFQYLFCILVLFVCVWRGCGIERKKNYLWRNWIKQY
jgi:hypothetical protein